MDAITTKYLKAAWPGMGQYYRRLIEKCLEQGVFPSVWKTGEIVMLPKIGKTDFTSFRSWRPIALLSCLGKGLERIVAKRMTWTALKAGIISPQHAGAIPKKSAVDLVACLVHDIELALAKGHKATLVTLDVQGAFDALLKNRLLTRMSQQGWKKEALRLTESFLTGRRVCTTLENVTTQEKQAQCGTPQGSPWSPLLYMLYLSELVGADPSRWGYADDIAVLKIGRSHDVTTFAAKAEVEKILKYGRENMITFAPEKIEVIHFSWGEVLKNRSLKLSIGTIKPPPREETSKGKSKSPAAVRWLGVHLDQKLTFKRHVEIRVSHANKVADHLRAIATATRGPPADGLHKAVKSVLLPTALYGHEVWYKGRTRPPKSRGQRKSVVSTCLGGYINLIQQCLLKAVRGVIPAWKTCPKDAMFAISGLPTAEIALEEARRRYAVRLRTIHADHPLANRQTPIINTVGPRKGLTQRLHTNIQFTASLVQEIQRPILYAPRYKKGSRLEPTRGVPKEKAAEEFTTWFKNLDPWEITVFSDGSQTKEGLGLGFVVYEGQTRVSEGKASLNPCGVVFDAEALGALRGLQRATELYPDTPVTLCMDNTAAIWCAQKDPSVTSQWVFIAIHELMDAKEITLKWCPGHHGIEGNEAADELAKTATKTGPLDPDSRPTAAGIKAAAALEVRALAKKWWEAASIPSGVVAAETIYNPGKCPITLKLPRRILGWYVSVITAHGDFKWYHDRYGHYGTEVHCGCTTYSLGVMEKGPEHLVHCTLTRLKLKEWPRSPKPRPRQDGKEWQEDSWPMRFHRLELKASSDRHAYWRWLVQNPLKFQEFCEITRYFDEICPAFTEPKWCCNGRRRPATPDPLDEEPEELELVEPGRLE